MDQYVVPQFIEVEAKIIGPISARQFVELLVGLGMSYLAYRLSPTPFLFIPLIFVILGFTGLLAFAKVNSQTMHYFLLNLLQTLKRPRLKLWYRLDYREPEEKIEEEEVSVVDKGPVTESRLASVSLMVDTGGTYVSDDEYRPANTAVSALGSPENGQTSAPAAAPAPTPMDASREKNQGINLGG